MYQRHWIPMLLTILCVTTACGSTGTARQDAAAGFPMTVDSCGREVTIEQPPQSVLTMGTDAPTLMAAAGAAERIDTRAAEFGFPLGRLRDELADIPLISPNQEPSKEVIIGTGADLVISYGLNGTSPQALAAAGIDTLVPSGRCDASTGGPAQAGVTFGDVYRDIALYGRLFGTEKQAAESVKNLRARVAAVKKQAQGRTATAAAVYFSGNALGAYGSSSMAHTQMQALGLTNVFADTHKRTFEVSLEEFIARDPDVVIVLIGSGPGATAQKAKQKLRALPGAETVTAIQQGRIISIGYTYLGGGPLAVDGLAKMAKQLEDFS